MAVGKIRILTSFMNLILLLVFNLIQGIPCFSFLFFLIWPRTENTVVIIIAVKFDGSLEINMREENSNIFLYKRLPVGFYVVLSHGSGQRNL